MNTKNVQKWVAEYNADPNCFASLWASDCVSHGEMTKEEADEFCKIILSQTWGKYYASLSPAARAERKKELETWDKPRNGNELEHAAKLFALNSL